mgnify:CR=1 FL=1
MSAVHGYHRECLSTKDKTGESLDKVAPELATMMVARAIPKSEVLLNDKINEAVLKEWSNLRKVDCWDEAHPLAVHKIRIEAKR